MTESARPAAQYIRMSTEQQNLSPIVQRDAIAAYAAAKGFEIVASYEDEGRSCRLLWRRRHRPVSEARVRMPRPADL
jgi:DNA invertase Pin-like site-specific DNA recombinase